MGVDKLITKYPEYLSALISKYSSIIDNYKFNLLASKFDNDYDYLKDLKNKYAKNIDDLEPQDIAKDLLMGAIIDTEGLGNIVDECIRLYGTDNLFGWFSWLPINCNLLECKIVPKGIFSEAIIEGDFHVKTSKIQSYAFVNAWFTRDYYYNLYIEEGCVEIEPEAISCDNAKSVFLPSSLQILGYQTMKNVRSVHYNGPVYKFKQLIRDSHWSNIDNLKLSTTIICTDGRLNKGDYLFY